MEPLTHDVVTSLNITVFVPDLDLLTYHPFVRYIPSMFSMFIVHVHIVPLLAFLHMYVCLYVCNQSSINQSIKNKMKRNSFHFDNVPTSLPLFHSVRI